MGISNRAAAMIRIRYATSIRMAAGAQIVVESGITPVVPSRKCPGVAINKAALEDNPYCQTACAAHTDASKNGKSSLMPQSSASRAKWIRPRASGWSGAWQRRTTTKCAGCWRASATSGAGCRSASARKRRGATGCAHCRPSIRLGHPDLGFRNVRTYIQSGNVVFTTKSITAATLSPLLEKAAGFAVPVVLRTATELVALIKNNPYPTSDTVHCAFLPAAPTKAQLAKLATFDATACLPSRYAIGKCEVYLDLPEGIGRDKLANTVLRAFPDATLRNWRTVLHVQGMVEAL